MNLHFMIETMPCGLWDHMIRRQNRNVWDSFPYIYSFAMNHIVLSVSNGYMPIKTDSSLIRNIMALMVSG